MFPEYDEFMKEISKKSIHTLRKYSHDLDIFMNYFHPKSVNDLDGITASQLRQYRDSLGLSESSTNANMRTIKSFMNWLEQNEYIQKNNIGKVKSLKEPKKIATYLTDEEWMSVLKSSHGKTTLMLSLMLNLGLRISEVAKIELNDISDGYIIIHGKGNKERKLPLNDDLQLAVSKYIKKYKPSQYLFGNDHEISTNSLRSRLKTALEMAGIDEEKIKNVSCHKTRHALATRLLNNGVDLSIVQQVLGHSNINTTLRYAKVNQKSMDDALLGKGL